MPVTRLLLMLVALACTACVREGAQDSASAVASQEAESGVEAFLRFGPAPLGRTRTELRQRLGEPDSTSRTSVANLHDPAVTDTLVVLRYPGLAAEIYVASFDDREFLASLTISDDRHLLPESPLRLGMSAEDIRLALGEPTRTEGDVLHYDCTTCGVGNHDTLELHLESGTLRRIVVQYWID